MSLVIESDNASSKSYSEATDNTTESTLTYKTADDTLENNVLSGYLFKYCENSRISLHRKLWFNYSASERQLCYYENPGDLVPLGSIDLSTSTFTTLLRDNIYLIKISSRSKNLLLGSDDRDYLFAWLAAFQKIRKHLILKADDTGTVPPLPPEPLIDPEIFRRGGDCTESDWVDLSPYSPASHRTSVVSNSVFYDNLDVDSGIVYPSNQNCHPTANQANSSNHPQDSASAYSFRQQFAGIKQKMLQRIRSSTGSASEQFDCLQCKQYETQIVILNDDKSALESELQANRELIKILKIQLESSISERDTFKKICRSDGSMADQAIEALGDQHRELSALRVKLRQSEMKLEEYRSTNEDLEKEKNSLAEQLKLMEELIMVKDQTVISLTNEIFELEKSPHVYSNETTDCPSSRNDQRDTQVHSRKDSSTNSPTDIEKLADSVKAYKIQNECLNQEIIELNEIRASMEKKQQDLQLKCFEWEAKCCQIHSKLLSLLKELNQAIMGQTDKSCNVVDGDNSQLESHLISQNTSIKALVLRLLDESSLDIPLSWKLGNKKRTDSFAYTWKHE